STPSCTQFWLPSLWMSALKEESWLPTIFSDNTLSISALSGSEPVKAGTKAEGSASELKNVSASSTSSCKLHSESEYLSATFSQFSKNCFRLFFVPRRIVSSIASGTKSRARQTISV